MKDVFVVVEIGGRQHIVSVGDEVDVNHIDGKLGDKVKFSNVLLRQDNKETELGMPFLNYEVIAEIIKQYKGKKIDVRKYKAKARYRRTYGHRQLLTKLKVASIKKSTGTKSSTDTSQKTKSSADKSKSTTKKSAKK